MSSHQTSKEMFVVKEQNTNKNNRTSSSTTETTESLSLQGLSPSLQLQIFANLNVPSLRACTQTCRSMRQLLLTTPGAVEDVWKRSCESQWPFMKFMDVHGLQLQDSLSFPIAASGCSAGSTLATLDTTSSNDNETSKLINFPMILSMAANKSHGIVSPKRRRTRRELTVRDKVVHFTGHVGVGDRCIKADAPLARPQIMSSKERKLVQQQKTITHRVWSKLSKSVSRRSIKSKVCWKPFVAPYPDAKNNTVRLTPRLVSYFEATLLAVPETDSRDPHDDTTESRGCVAVGVACRGFKLCSYMPGWDTNSFGYHGDDGGVYHGSGEPVATSYPSFSEGDTVGCGIDYENRKIFYTLNGKLLDDDNTTANGALHVPESMLVEEVLYPVVGMDSHNPVSCNFGTEIEEPFVFDLDQLIQRSNVVGMTLRNQFQQKSKSTSSSIPISCQ